MYHLALTFLAAMLAGFGLIIVTTLAASFISTQIAAVLIAIGAIAVIVFAPALLFLAVKLLLKQWR